MEMEWIKYALVLSLLASFTNTKASAKSQIKNIHEGGVLSTSLLWVNEERALYWADVVSQKIFRLEVDTGYLTSVYIGYGPVSLIVRVKDYPKLLVITVRTELYFLDWDNFVDDKSLRFITAVDSGKPNNRCNDGKVDAEGRIWFGTMGREKNQIYDRDLGSLYMVTENNYKSPEIKIRPVSVSNGITWNSDNTKMFYIDTGSLNIVKYDFDLKSGYIANGTTLFSFPENNLSGFPDGMTIDTEDNLWVACYLDGKVAKIDSRTGEIIKTYKVPASKVTSVMWGGDDYSTLYVSTSSKDLTEKQLAKEPQAGSVFAITGTGSRGFPVNEFIFKNADKY